MNLQGYIEQLSQDKLLYFALPDFLYSYVY